MADAQLKVTMASQDIRVGDGDNSRLSIDIRNDGSAKATFTFYITIPTGFVAAEAAEAASRSRGSHPPRTPLNLRMERGGASARPGERPSTAPLPLP